MIIWWLQLRGGIKPDKVTWLLWSVIPFIVFAAQINQGVGIQSLMTFMTGFTPFIIFVASFFNKKSYWRLGKLDIICGTLSIIGILFWYITKTGNTAIFFSILADGMAAIPTIVKAYYAPETEGYKVYLMGASSAVITLLTIREWSFAYYGWPVYILILTSLIAILVKFKIGTKKLARGEFS